MEPEHYKFGGGSAETVLHPIVLAVMLLVMIALLVMPRRHMVSAFLCGAFLIPAGQEVLIGTVHIFAYRFIVLAALIRMARSRQTPLLSGNWNSIDSMFSLSVLFHAVAFTLLYLEMPAVVNQGGFIWDYLGGYMFLRYAIRSEEDTVRAIKCFAVLAIVFAVSMIREQLTGQNLFGLLGGVNLMSEIREGRIRSQSVFQHSILAGTYGAIMLPLFVLLWKNTRSKVLAALGSISATAMTLTCACSTPVLSYMAGVVGLCLWPARRHMRWLRWGLVIGFASLSVVMNAPVWYVIAHASAVEGSSGYHRADLVDTFLRNIGDWWLLGTKSNGAWGNMMFDTSNQYVNLGITGGLMCLIFFIATISSSFARIGRMRRSVEGNNRKSEWFLWLLGVALFANVVAFFGISYFDQTRVAWFALLAMISAARAEVNADTRTPATVNELIPLLPGPRTHEASAWPEHSFRVSGGANCTLSDSWSLSADWRTRAR